ncbi:MAG: hypothetical protein ACFUZC_10865 [Chthoniobacteraceae bacterium]
MASQSRTEFCAEYRRIHAMASEAGLRGRPLRADNLKSPFVDKRHQMQFLKACHCGFEKAQNTIVELLAALRSDQNIDRSERMFRELALRKIIDGIAVQLLQGKSHLIRRFVLHDKPPTFELKTVQEALKAANRLNNESRLTFALVADISTFVHVCDILRADHRERRLSLIELKGGRINQLLLSELERYKPEKDSMQALETDPRIHPEHRKQAKRMLRQQIRKAQVEHMFSHDEGTDIMLDKPLIFTKEEVQLTHYDELLNTLCTGAREKGFAMGTSNHCIHLAVGYADEPETALCNARRAMDYGIAKSRKGAPNGLVDIEATLAKTVPKEDLFQIGNLFESNMTAMSSRPFTTWYLHSDHFMGLMSGRMVVLAAFDLAAFIWLGRAIGLRVELTSRKDAAHEAQSLGSVNVPTWGGRALRYVFGPDQHITLLSGMFSRFFNDLTNPLPLMVYWRAPIL